MISLLYRLRTFAADDFAAHFDYQDAGTVARYKMARNW